MNTRRASGAAGITALGIMVVISVWHGPSGVQANGIIDVAAAGSHTCAILSPGGVWCWGTNGGYQLGDGTYSDPRMTPSPVAGLTRDVLDVDAGRDMTCAITKAHQVKCWGFSWTPLGGNPGDNFAEVPLDVAGLGNNIDVVDAGWMHYCALASTGAVYCWGGNRSGQVGDGTSINERGVPVEVCAQLSYVTYECLTHLGGIKAIAVGDEHTCALDEQGGVVCWGDNSYDQLGPDQKCDRACPIPVPMSGLSSGAIAIAAGSYHTCVITEEHRLKCWGSDFSGQTGAPPGGCSPSASPCLSTPVDMLDINGQPLADVTGVAAGGANTCVVFASGGLSCAGSNRRGQLGTGSTSTDPSRFTPVFSDGVTAVSVGTYHACAVRSGDTLYCWGSNDSLQLGSSTTTYCDSGSTPCSTLPIGVNGLSPKPTATPCSSEGCPTSTTTQTPTFTSTPTPTATPTPTFPAIDIALIAAGTEHTCILKPEGGVRCWGKNNFNQVGQETTEICGLPVSGWSELCSRAPLPVLGLEKESGIAGLTAGSAHTCALMRAGGVKCWGNDSVGQIGVPPESVGLCRSTACSALPQDVGGLEPIVALDAGDHHTCAITGMGGIKCWGWNGRGQLGDGGVSAPFEPRFTPSGVAGLETGVKAISAGGFHTCAVTSAGSVKCWGLNESGQLGGQSQNFCYNLLCSTTPIDVRNSDGGLLTGVRSLSAGRDHTCALTDIGGVKCWGRNHAGQLGDGTLTGRANPVDVVGLTSGVLAISAGETHTCGLTVEGAVTCWGLDDVGQLGDGPSDPLNAIRLVPGSVQGLPAILDMQVGGRFTCAIAAAGGIRCWGRNLFGELGAKTLEECGDPNSYTFPSVFPCSTIPVPAGVTSKPTPTPTACPEDGCGPHTPTETLTVTATATATATATPTHTHTPTRTTVPPMLGDADCNRAIGARDASLVLQLDGHFITSLPCPGNADVNGDGRIDALDALLILQFVAGLIDGLPP